MPGGVSRGGMLKLRFDWYISYRKLSYFNTGTLLKDCSQHSVQSINASSIWKNLLSFIIQIGPCAPSDQYKTQKSVFYQFSLYHKANEEANELSACCTFCATKWHNIDVLKVSECPKIDHLSKISTSFPGSLILPPSPHWTGVPAQNFSSKIIYHGLPSHNRTLRFQGDDQIFVT